MEYYTRYIVNIKNIQKFCSPLKKQLWKLGFEPIGMGNNGESCESKTAQTAPTTPSTHNILSMWKNLGGGL